MDTLHIHSDGSVSLDASSSLVANLVIADGNLDWSGGNLNIELNTPVTIPLTKEAAEATTVGLDHTLLACFYDFLPAIAG